MKKNCFYVFLVLLACLGFVTLARAQAVEELQLSVSRDFGSSDGTGNIQGEFSMKVTGPSNLVWSRWRKLPFTTYSSPVYWHRIKA